MRPCTPSLHELGRAAGVGGDDRRFERHRFEHGVRRALVVGRLHEQVERVMQPASTSVTWPSSVTLSLEAERVALIGRAPVAGCRRRR